MKTSFILFVAVISSVLSEDGFAITKKYQLDFTSTQIAGNQSVVSPHGYMASQALTLYLKKDWVAKHFQCELTVDISDVLNPQVRKGNGWQFIPAKRIVLSNNCDYSTPVRSMLSEERQFGTFTALSASGAAGPARQLCINLPDYQFDYNGTFHEAGCMVTIDQQDVVLKFGSSRIIIATQLSSIPFAGGMTDYSSYTKGVLSVHDGILEGVYDALLLEGTYKASAPSPREELLK